MSGTALVMDPDGPAMMPPDGQVSDFDTRGPYKMTEAALIICATLATLSVISRVTSRLMMKPRQFGVEEGLLICALGTYSGLVYLAYTIAIFPGTFVHQWNIRLRDAGHFTWRLHIALIFCFLTLMLLKVAILVDWAHLFNPLKKRDVVYWTTRILLAANVVYYITATFLEAFRCTPQRMLWDTFYVGGYCPINVTVLNLATAAINIVSDVAMLALPQWVIWRLHMTRATRAGVSVVFLIGILAIVCALCRLAWIAEFLHSEDELYLASIIGVFAIGENTAGFLIIGVPSVPKVFRTFSRKDSTVRSGLSGIKLPSWTGRRRTAEGPDGGSGSGSGRALVQASWRTPVHHKSRGAWAISENDSLEILSPSTTRIEAGRHPAHSVNTPQNSIKRDVRVDVVNERVG